MTRTRIEADREDLMAEAANLRQRVELRVPGWDHAVTIGCNDFGHWSFYFGAEPMYRFDAEGRLRRAVRDGKLYRTQGETLAELERVRLDHETQLQRRDLDPQALEVFLREAGSDLQLLASEFLAGRLAVLREIGAGPEFMEALTERLQKLGTAPLTLAPPLATKRR